LADPLGGADLIDQVKFEFPNPKSETNTKFKCGSIPQLGETKPFSSLSFCGLFRVSELGIRIFAIGKIADGKIRDVKGLIYGDE
jgi:hypothetical protein